MMPRTMTDVPTTAPGDADALVSFLRERDAACPLCRYNLRGLTSTRCPECGRELELRIGLSEPRQGAWIMCTIAMAASAGIGVICAMGFMKYGMESIGSSDLKWFCAFFFLAAVPLAIALLLLRRRFLLLSAPLQWTLAAMTTLGFLLCTALMMILDDA
jgi:hypothetical protein